MRPYSPKDIPTINAWLELRHMAPINEHLFPDIGYIVDGIGAGFIYQTDSKLCFLDGYISNPKTTKEQRKEAFDKISDVLILTAKNHGFTHILAYTQNPEIAKRCKRFHFRHKGDYSLFIREI